MKRRMFVIPMKFQTRLRPCRIAVCAEVENALLNDHLRTMTTCCGTTSATESIRNVTRDGGFRQYQPPNPSDRDSDEKCFSQDSTRRPAVTGLPEQSP